MKLCDTCGNTIDNGVMRCPFCDSPQQAAPLRRPRTGIRTLNLEAGLPTVEAGLAKLQREITTARNEGVPLLRVIHGWGSSGTGGRLRDACRSYLGRERDGGRVKSVLAGDDYSGASLAGRGLLARHPALQSKKRADTANPGITFVEL